ncbi:hypothetical protein D3C71_1235500 [compost metagenome]
MVHGVVHVEVDDQDAVVAQGAKAVGVERFRTQGIGDAAHAVAVQEDHVGVVRHGAQVVGRVGLDDLEAVVVARHHEGVAQRNDGRVDLDDFDAGAGQVAIAELGQRAAAQAHHQDAGGLGLEQHEAHHHPRVFDFQRVGIKHRHAALDLLLREMQRAARARVLNERPVDGRWLVARFQVAFRVGWRCVGGK